MAFNFKLYHDAALTQLFDWSGGDTKTFQTSGDTVLYFGSTDSSIKCQKSGGGNFNITPSTTTDVWTASTTYAVNDIVRTTDYPAYYYKATAITTGTSDATEPDWATEAPDVDDTTVDNGVTWTNMGGYHETTEIKLATTSAGLTSATAGAALTITAPVLGGVANAQAIHIRVTDATGGGVAQSDLSLDFDTLEQVSV